MDWSPVSFDFEDGTRYIGICYAEQGAGSVGDFSVCNVGGENYGKETTWSDGEGDRSMRR